MEQHQSLITWYVLFAITQATALVLILIDNNTLADRLSAAGLLSLNGVWFLLYGKKLVNRADDDWRGLVYAAGSLATFAPAVWFSGNATFALFGLVPQIYMVLPVAWAFWPMALFVFTPQILTWAAGAVPALPWPAALLIIAFSQAFGWAISRMSEQSRQRAELLNRIEALTIEAERARWAGEIHDTLAQGFTSIITLLQGAQPNVELALRTARENLREARALVASNAPSPLDGSSLEEALRRLVNGVELESSFRVIGDPVGLQTSAEVVLLRTVQEALTNVARHSGASRVDVVMRFDEDGVSLEVRDDGRGFGDAPEGFGLRGMRARLEQVGGTLSLSSDEGASVLVEVPL
ncbi:sensor histidine kinase [Lentzea flaviverrucosa]|uniref:Signal transduction histidine kinase n=1 Tax=Lentzea flaviverrucosa TaxID=200379 RepID=A0A1H9LXK1_9PSEU|nr:sensor histidine kinase [Lentzea flaviverrucosa]RDI31150.1 signal transduction histidine kinase [Lentzea flaviverrucosa]SER16171.1 Signal transduction histidine kinase [Lentzea flaviverrucosa]